jgi:hypothetical protein
VGPRADLISVLKRKIFANTGNQILPFKMPGHDHDKADDSIVHSSPGGPAVAKTLLCISTAY